MKRLFAILLSVAFGLASLVSPSTISRAAAVPTTASAAVGSHLQDDLPAQRIFIPMCFQHYCRDYQDSFDFPSGWPLLQENQIQTEYLQGEYRIVAQDPSLMYLIKAPVCQRESYFVAVDARWGGEPGAAYGLMFGAAEDFSQYYLALFWTYSGAFDLYYVGPDEVMDHIVGGNYSSGDADDTINRIQILRRGTDIILTVNENMPRSFYDPRISGLTSVGLVVVPFSDTPGADARFDNFQVTNWYTEDIFGAGPSASPPGNLPSKEYSVLPLPLIIQPGGN